MDLVTREARLFKYGSGSGTNFSRIRGKREPLSGGGVSSGLISFLKVADRSASAVKSGGTTRRAAKMVTLDVDHPDVEQYVNWKVEEEYKVACLTAGSEAILRSVEGMRRAVSGEKGGQGFDRREIQNWRKAIAAAVKAGIPPDLSSTILKMLEQGDEELDSQGTPRLGRRGLQHVSGQSSNNSLRITNEFMEAVLSDGGVLPHLA
jgi:ribonucleoside-diphosphate reductase alpha chain